MLANVWAEKLIMMQANRMANYEDGKYDNDEDDNETE